MQSKKFPIFGRNNASSWPRRQARLVRKGGGPGAAARALEDNDQTGNGSWFMVQDVKEMRQKNTVSWNYYTKRQAHGGDVRDQVTR